MSLLVRSVAAALGRTQRIPHRRAFSGSANQEVNALLEEIKKAPTVTEEMVMKTLEAGESCRTQILRQNALRTWMFAVAGIAGFRWGFSKVPHSHSHGSEEVTDDEIKQRTGSLIGEAS